MSKINTITDAMRNRKMINLAYADLGQANPRGPYAGITLFRDVIPFTLGTTTKGNLALRGFDSYRGEWRLFLIERIGRIQVSDETFNERSYPAYKGTDKGLSIQVTIKSMPRVDVGAKKVTKALQRLRGYMR